MLKRIAIFMLFVTGPALAGSSGEPGRYVETGDYLSSAFPSDVPTPETVWVTGELRNTVESVLGHKFGVLRVRYWRDGARSAWILDEIGKELPITIGTIGVTVDDGTIDNVRVLEFRESRGWEVRYPFFTDQFADARLAKDRRLDRNIDGITVSVRAVTRIARVALLMHEHVSQEHVAKAD